MMTRRQTWIIVAAGLVFALIFGVRQSVALFIGPLNSASGLGIAAISLAFASATLMWGIPPPIAASVADRYGAARVGAARQAPACAGGGGGGEDHARRGARRLERPELPAPHRRLLRVRLPRRLHRHAPAGRGGAVRPAAGGRRVVAVAHWPVQHRGQLRFRLGDRPLADEERALAPLRLARPC